MILANGNRLSISPSSCIIKKVYHMRKDTKLSSFCDFEVRSWDEEAAKEVTCGASFLKPDSGSLTHQSVIL